VSVPAVSYGWFIMRSYVCTRTPHLETISARVSDRKRRPGLSWVFACMWAMRSRVGVTRPLGHAADAGADPSDPPLPTPPPPSDKPGRMGSRVGEAPKEESGMEGVWFALAGGGRPASKEIHFFTFPIQGT
jgi:hypothetical protein